ncbi:MAG: phage GP46 family protein [Afipia sp.]|nr:phage GP46 family protein [Afipia sp.]
MADVVIRAAEGCAPDSYALWDSVWDADRGLADWKLSDGSEPLNRGGLQAGNAITTAVILALFTDKRIEETHPLYFLADGDPRGYFGDAIDVRDDLHEGALGSHLWLLERAPLTIRNVSAAEWAKQFAIEALMPLQAQGAVVRIEVEATANELRSRLDLTVRLFGRDGQNVFDRKFDLLWNQVAS